MAPRFVQPAAVSGSVQLLALCFKECSVHVAASLGKEEQLVVQDNQDSVPDTPQPNQKLI
jgi:hypothetical protein